MRDLDRSSGRRPRVGLLVLSLVSVAWPVGGQDVALVYPVDIVAAGTGWVIADFKAHGLLQLSTDGVVAPLQLGAGMPRTPLYGTRAVVTAPDGNGYLVADPATFGLYRVDASAALSTITTELDQPQGLVRYDDSSVLVSDLRNGFGVLLRVTLDGQITEFADIGSPKGIVADGDGFAVVSHGERALFRVGRDGRVSTLAAGPPFDFPHDLVREEDGSFVVTDGYAAALFRVSTSGEVTILAQGAPLVNPQGIAHSARGTYLVTDPQAGAIFEVDRTGSMTLMVRARPEA